MRELIIVGLISLGLLVYLFIAMIWPEKFRFGNAERKRHVIQIFKTFN